MDKYDSLKLENQICFPLYVCSKEVVRKYKPYLDKLSLTYTQYIAMMVIWEKGSINVTELGRKLYLDSGTLTPLLKKLEKKGYITRSRDVNDERNVIITVTEAGMALREDAVEIPEMVGKCIDLSEEEAGALYLLLGKLMGVITDEQK